MNFLSRLKLWQKLALLVTAMAIPSALLGIFYLGAANSQVALAKDEIEGARYKVGETWKSIESDWDRLKNEGAKLSPDEAVARHNVLLDHIQKLGETVAARSGMTVDPSPETAGLIQIATRTVPGALIASGT